jgi:hypothetical protein
MVSHCRSIWSACRVSVNSRDRSTRRLSPLLGVVILKIHPELKDHFNNEFLQSLEIELDNSGDIKERMNRHMRCDSSSSSGGGHRKCVEPYAPDSEALNQDETSFVCSFVNFVPLSRYCD